MSSAPSHPERKPLHERSASQTNTVAAIRVVPYSPPRPLGDTNKVEQLGGCYKPEFTPAIDGSSRVVSQRQPLIAQTPKTVPPRQTPKTSDSWIHNFKHDVSGSKLGSPTGTRRSDHPTTPVPASFTTTAMRSSPDDSEISYVHASSGLEDERAATDAERPRSRRLSFVPVASGRGTFSLKPLHIGQATVRSSTLSLSTQSSFERLSELFSSEGRPSTPLTTLLEQQSTSQGSPTSISAQSAGDLIANPDASPWNYRLVGGLRKVPFTPDTKQNPTTSRLSDSIPDADYSPPLPSLHAPRNELSDFRSLLKKTSFQSSHSASTTSEKTNYRLYRPRAQTRTIPDTGVSEPPSSYGSVANYEILGRSSPPTRLSLELSPAKTLESDTNYVVHGNPTASSQSSYNARTNSHLGYSQESLIVPPLQPVKKRVSSERIGPYKSRSRESFRTGSLTSINNIIGQESLQAFLSTPIALSRAGGPSNFANLGLDTWAITSMEAQHHQWSSQLSTVMSESESGSGAASRSISMLSGPGGRNNNLTGNRAMPGMSSTVAAPGDVWDSPSGTAIERPQQAYGRGATVRLVRDQDEHGDGLADLHDVHELHQRPSRRRLGSFLSSTSSDRNLHSSSSSRANSLKGSTIPTWARLYYGSGERRWLRHATSIESMTSDVGDSRPPSSFRGDSPSVEHLPFSIYSPRRRPREVRPHSATSGCVSDPGSVHIMPAPMQGIVVRPVMRKKTSSVWSPHLVRDQRASGYNIWQPPSIDWSTESGVTGQRNIQVVAFIVGFLVPIAWMVAALLPLPSRPEAEMMERSNTSLSDLEARLPQRVDPTAQRHYHSVRWWRNLNRIMSIVGTLVLVALITILVVGVTKDWV